MTLNKLFEFDDSFNCTITGTDEAGRGPAAGGVWAAAVCFNKNCKRELFDNLNDSKKLTPKKREELFKLIKENSIFSIKAVKK